ncbi:MAG: alpha-glucan family phosphorylase [Candidatus Levybacteria bacterium]|nr:alpha-glucan family phosphorylase [Candidatus Levybacteria bacterium]
MINEHATWFEEFRTTKPFALLKKKPLAYFSIEYSLADNVPTYAGGLGILAGDYIKELADQKIPAVAVGLYYQSRYGFDPHHTTTENHPILTSADQGLEPVLDKDKNILIIKVPVKDHEVLVKAWLWQHNSIPLYLLDTNVPENDPSDRAIGFQLYAAEKEVRIKQEMILGIGGFRLLEALDIKPSLYHMNEGHSALLELEIIRHEMQKQKIGFGDAAKLASHHVVFTNHTLVPAGNDIFSNELLSVMLNKYASELEVPIATILELGNIRDTYDFSMTVFAMRLAGKINGVSKLHAREANKVWAEYTLEPVTNGIHIPSWENSATHKESKQKLLDYIANETGQKWQENELVLGWARRMVRYKRPLALFGELEKFIALAKNSNRPVRVVMAGISHQADDEGRELIGQLQELLKKDLAGSVVYLADYNKTLGKIMISGCDVWLNTPVVGSEACGTSGMKASLNGVLPLSTKDGWLDEVDVNKIGWCVASDTIQYSLLQTLEEQVIPTYYAEDKSTWNELQKNGRELILHQFSATRMLRDYFEKTYLPIINASYEHYEL